MTRLRGRYQPLALVGRGGQGEVWRALDHQHDRQVALKIVALGTQQSREELMAEARILLELKPHASLPIVRDDFFVGDRYHLVIDWVEGRSLQSVLETQGGGLPSPTVANYVEQIANALEHLHSQHPPFVHRDVKPSNLILTSEGRVVLVDFGLSCREGDHPVAAGSRPFMAPEILAGQPPSPASDIFSLGATTFALLTGAPPAATDISWRGKHKRIVETIESVLRPALALDSARRPESATALAEAVREHLTGETGRSKGRTERLRFGPIRVRRSVLVALLAVLVFSAVGIPILKVGRHHVTGKPGASETTSPSSGGASAAGSTGPAATGLPAGIAGQAVGKTPVIGAPPRLQFSVAAAGDYTYYLDSDETWSGTLAYPERTHGEEKSVTVERVSEKQISVRFPYQADNAPTTERQETMNLRYSAGGVVLERDWVEVNAAGCVANGPPCPNSDVRYPQPILLVPYPIHVGQQWSGTAHSVGSVDGQPARTEHYSGRVEKTANLVVAGHTYSAYVIMWSSDMSGTDSGSRSKEIWFSPKLGLWLKANEKEHWTNSNGAYDDRATWELRSLP